MINTGTSCPFDLDRRQPVEPFLPWPLSSCWRIQNLRIRLCRSSFYFSATSVILSICGGLEKSSSACAIKALAISPFK